MDSFIRKKILQLHSLKKKNAKYINYLIYLKNNFSLILSDVVINYSYRFKITDIIDQFIQIKVYK
jgi:Tfp pilus assembly protein PilZ